MQWFNNSCKTLFISDLHLDKHHPEITQRFLQLLNHLNPSVDALYILGDLFEVWIGDDDQTPFHTQIVQAIKSITAKGLPVYLLHGNRDFLIGKRFLQETGCILLPDPTIIMLYHTPVLIMHGDTLCTRDVAYLRSRKKVRHPWLQKLFLFLPLRLRQHIANKMRAASLRHTQSTLAEIMDVTQAEVERVMQQHQVAYLIHGHTHKPGMHSFLLTDQTALRIVLDAWHHHGNMLVWDENGEKNLINF